MATANGDESASFQPGGPGTQENDADVDDNLNEFEDIDGDDWPSQENSDWDPEYDGEDIDNSDILETQKGSNQNETTNDGTNGKKMNDSTPSCTSKMITAIGTSNFAQFKTQGKTRGNVNGNSQNDNHQNVNDDLEEFKNDPIGVESALIAITRPEEKKYYDGEGILSTKFGGDHDDNKDDEKKQGFQCWQCPICQSINSLVFDTYKKRKKK